MDQHDVVGTSGQCGQGVGDRLLTVFAAFDHANAIRKAILGNLRLNALHLGIADGYIDCRYPLDRGKCAQRMNEDGDAVEDEKLLGLGAGHPCA